MEHTYPQTTVEVWPVTDGHGTTRLFANEKAAGLYAAEHGGAVGAAMPVRTARTVWRRVCVKFDFDADSYEVADCSDPYETRPATSRHPSVSWRGGFRLEVCARTEAHARAIADYIGRLSEKPEFKRRPIGWLASRLTGPTLAHIDEDGSLTPGAPKWMELPERLA